MKRSEYSTYKGLFEEIKCVTHGCPLSCQQKMKIDLGLPGKCLWRSLLSSGVNFMVYRDTYNILKNVILTETLPAWTERNSKIIK